jgi:Dephospho-CoA kinase
MAINENSCSFLRLARLMDRNKLSEADAKKRIAAQMKLEDKCQKSDFVIENSSNEKDTEEQTLKIISILQDCNQHWKIRGYIMATTAVFCGSIAWLLNYKYKIFSNSQ